jgi:hypothetical protein
MGKLKWILIILVVLVVIGAGGYGLYILGDSDQSALERLRDIAVLVIGFFALMTVVLMLAITGLLLYLVLTIKDRVVPVMETLQDTAERVKGTTEFLSEEMVAPVISVYGTVARARAMTRTVTGRDRGNERKTIAKLLKR